MPKYDVEVAIELSGPEGNAFYVLGAVRKALREAGASDEAIESFRTQATSGDYTNLLEVCREWVEFDGYYEDDEEDEDDD
jgi:hypothetical protein